MDDVVQITATHCSNASDSVVVVGLCAFDESSLTESSIPHLSDGFFVSPIQVHLPFLRLSVNVDVFGKGVAIHTHGGSKRHADVVENIPSAIVQHSLICSLNP